MPELDGGRYAVKRVVDDNIIVRADILKDGHDLLAARVRYSGPDEDEWRVVPMHYDENADQWAGVFRVDRAGRWSFTVDAWTDRFGTWRRDLQKKVDAGQDVSSELLEGAELIDTVARRARFGNVRNELRATALAIRDVYAKPADRIALAMNPALHSLLDVHYSPPDLVSYARELDV
ncbi:MAG: maltotransferase domain-containing protein, partial [Gemmatimonadales bacterium]